MAEPQLKDRQIRLIVAGEFYSDSEPYLKLIRELGLEEKVILHTDYIPDVLINRYFGAADLVVQPYKTATQSGVTQIGYHFNKAMLVTDVGGLGEIVANGKSGYVVKPEVSAIAEAIADFYDRERQTDFEKETVKLKGQFSWSKMTDVMMELYADINSKNES